MGNRQMLRIS